MLHVKNVLYLVHNKYSVKVYYYSYYERVPRNHFTQIPHFANEETVAQEDINDRSRPVDPHSKHASGRKGGRMMWSCVGV